MSFTEDVFGTFIEVINTVLLMNVLSQDYLKKKVRLTIAMVLASIGVGLLDLIEVPFISIFNYLVVVVCLAIAVNRNIFRVLFELSFATAILILIEHILLISFYKFQGVDSLEFINRCIQLFITFIVCGAIGLNRKLQIKVRMFYDKYQEEFYLISATLFCFSMIEMFLWKINNSIVFHQFEVISTYTTLWLLLCLYLLRQLIENKKQRENIRLHEQYMETTENLLDSLYSEKHDFNKHLQAIQGLCQYEESGEAVQEIEQYIGELKHKELNSKKGAVSISTGNGVVNALLYSKTKEAEKRSIQFYYVPNGHFPEFPCEPYEMVQILGNLLDNAFEYLEGLDEDERVVTLAMDEQEGKKRIEIRNTCHLEKSFAAGISSKNNYSTKSGERRGYGLRNVKTIVLDYHGKMRIFQEEDQFIVEILF